jgi:type IV secretory pathway VirB2 component (pilin)
MKKFLPHLLAVMLLLGTGGIIVHAQAACPDGFDQAPNNDPSQCTCAEGNANACAASSGPTNTTGGGPSISTTIPNPFNCGGATNCTLGTFLNTIIQSIVLPLGGILAILAFIWVGFMYVNARGKPAEIETANRALLYVAIGTTVLLGATVISAVIQNTLNQLK